MALYNGHQEDSSGNILLSIGNGMTATLETGTTASQAYAKGAYVFFNNRLCKATAAISSGNTLSIGTNLAQTSMGEELTSHLRASNGDEFYFDYKDGKAGYYPSASKTASEFVPFGGSDRDDYTDQTITSATRNKSSSSPYTVTYDQLTRIDAVVGIEGWGGDSYYHSATGIGFEFSGNVLTVTDKGSATSGNSGNHKNTITCRQYHAFD